MSLIQEQAAWFDSTPEQYHADPADSFSTLMDYDRNPALYWLRYVKRTHPRETSDALEFGTAFHCAVLEPERFDAQYVVPPKFNRRSNAGKDEEAAWLSANAGKTPIDAADLETLRRMQASVLDNPRARQYVEQALHRERGIKWTCFETGLALRARPDIVGPGYVVNLKTCRGILPHEFRRAVRDHRYDAQAALDIEAVAALTSAEFQHVLIAVEKTAPWECAVYRLTGDPLLNGRNWLTRVRTALRASREFDHWKSPRWNVETPLTLSRWEMGDLFDDE